MDAVLENKSHVEERSTDIELSRKIDELVWLFSHNFHTSIPKFKAKGLGIHYSGIFSCCLLLNYYRFVSFRNSCCQPVVFGMGKDTKLILSFLTVPSPKLINFPKLKTT